MATRLQGRRSVWTKLSPWWQGILSAMGIASLVLGYFSLPPAPPKLVVERVSCFDLLSFTRSLSSVQGLPIELTWKDQVGLGTPDRIPIQNLQQECLRVRNAGDTAFEWNTDIADVMTFHLEGDGEILLVKNQSVDRPEDRYGTHTFLSADRKSFDWRVATIPPGRQVIFYVFHNGKDNGLQVSGRLKRQAPLVIQSLPSPSLFFPKAFLLRTVKVVGVYSAFLGCVSLFLGLLFRGWRATEAFLTANVLIVLPMISAMWLTVGIAWLGPTEFADAMPVALAIELVIASALGHTVYLLRRHINIPRFAAIGTELPDQS